MKSVVIICVCIVAFQWLFFGVMQFTHHDATVLQIPDFYPRPNIIAYVLGIVQIAVALLLFPQQTRKKAALASVGLLIILIPSVIKIILNDDVASSIPFLKDGFRAIVIPNNLFLALCSLYIWRFTQSAPVVKPNGYKA